MLSKLKNRLKKVIWALDKIQTQQEQDKPHNLYH